MMYNKGEQIHVASSPSFSVYRGMATALGPEANTAVSLVYAVEGQTFVLARPGERDPARPHALQRARHPVPGTHQRLPRRPCAYTEDLDVSGSYTRVSGYQRTQAALDEGLDFTAIFDGTDMVAVGALAALREADLSVPADVSLVGFDDVPFATDLTPALTTVRVPYEELAGTAVRLALEREKSLADDHVVLSTQLVIRQSVRSPSGHRVDRARRSS